MIDRTRNSRLALTLISLALVSWLLLGAFVGVLALEITPSTGNHPSAQDNSQVSTAIGLLLGLPVGWWVFARITGNLWKSNNGITWKLMMCTGALALTLSALAYDLVVKVMVNRLYIGAEEAEYMILPPDAEEPSSIAVADTQTKGKSA